MRNSRSIQNKVQDYSDINVKRIPSAMMTYKGRNELSIIRLADPIRNYRKNTMDFINDIKSVLVEFNNVPDFKSASNPAIYKVRRAGKKQKIGSVEVYRNLAMLSMEDNDKAT